MSHLENRTVTGLVVATALIAAVAAACDLPWEPTLDDAVRDLARRKGRLVRVTEAPFYYDGTTTVYDVTLASSTGLQVELAVRRAFEAVSTNPRPGVVLIGGVKTGRGAVDLLPNDNPHVSFVLNFPGVMRERDPDVLLRKRDEVRDALRDVPATLSLTVDYLHTLDYVDQDRIALIGVSFGGFLAPQAAAVDRRIRNVALMYTGADLAGLVTEGARRNVPDAVAILFGDMALLGLQDMDPLHWIGHIAPRHVLMVNGLRDDEILPENAQALFDAASQPKEMIWLPTGHLAPDDTVLIKELVDTAMARLPVLNL